MVPTLPTARRSPAGGDALSDGATIIAQPAEAWWGGKFGMLTDRFGVRWMFDITDVGTGVDTVAGAPE